MVKELLVFISHLFSFQGYSDDVDKRYSLVNPMREGDRLRPPPLISPQGREEPSPRHGKSGESVLFRPFDSKSLTNGYDSSTSEKRDKDSVFHFMDSKKYSHDKQSLSHDRKTSERDPRETDPYKFGSMSSAFCSLDNHVSKVETSPSSVLRNNQYHPSSSKEPPHGVQHNSHHTPLNVPSYNTSNVSNMKSITSYQNNGSFNNSSISSHTSNIASHMSSSTSANRTRESQPCVSKLDLKEKRKSESQMSDRCCSDSDCEQFSEEESKGRKLLIASGPPLKLDKSPKKIELLNQLGLTTQQQKKGMVGIFYAPVIDRSVACCFTIFCLSVSPFPNDKF